MDRILGDLELIQTVERLTWTRTVNNVVKESILDHIYVTNPYTIPELNYEWQFFTDHATIS